MAQLYNQFMSHSSQLARQLPISAAADGDMCAPLPSGAPRTPSEASCGHPCKVWEDSGIEVVLSDSAWHPLLPWLGSPMQSFGRGQL